MDNMNTPALVSHIDIKVLVDSKESGHNWKTPSHRNTYVAVRRGSQGHEICDAHNPAPLRLPSVGESAVAGEEHTMSGGRCMCLKTFKSPELGDVGQAAAYNTVISVYVHVCACACACV